MNNKHPYFLRLYVRKRLPWFLINLGIAGKGKDCKSVNAKHKWYNNGNNSSACYYCKTISKGEKWN